MINIGITQRQIVLNEEDVFDSLDNNLYKFLYELEFNLYPIPNYYGSQIDNQLFYSWIFDHNIRCFVFSGGGDPYKIDERFKVEQKIMNLSKDQSLPIFGICRGLERMVLHEGGTLKETKGHVNAYTKIQGEIQGEFKCFHNLCVDKLPDNFQITSFSEDHVIESIKHNFYPWEACMWHPERTFERNLNFEKKLKNFFSINV